MATKTLGNSGADYATWADWIVYLKTLGALASSEIGQITAAEFDGGDCQLTGAGITPSSTNRLIIEPASGAKFSGNPLRYGDGARTIFNGSNENLYVNWGHVEIRDIAIKKTTSGYTSGNGTLSVADNLASYVSNVVIEGASITVNAHGFDDRAQAAALRENIVTVNNGAAIVAGIKCSNHNKTYKNCAAHAFGSPASGTGLQQSYATGVVWINCESLGFATDFSSSYGASSKNCATNKASGSSNIASMTGAQFDAVGATEHEAWGTYGSHDLRVASGSVKLKNLGAASGGTTTDIIGQSISGGTRDIGPFEYQGAGAPEVAVSGNGNSITDGDATPSATDHTDFGSVVQGGSAISRTFTVSNTGTADLTTSGLTVPTGFSVTEGLSATIAASSSDTFTVEMATAVVGVKSGDISFTTNDSDEGTFNFAITGEVTAAPPPPPPPSSEGIPFSPTFSPVALPSGLLIR